MYLSKCILEHFSKEPVPRLHQTVQEVHGRKNVKNMGEGKRGAAEDKGVSRQGGQGQSHAYVLLSRCSPCFPGPSPGTALALPRVQTQVPGDVFLSFTSEFS